MTIVHLHLIRLTAECTSAFFTTQLRQHAQSYRYEVVVFSQIRHPQVAQAKVVDRGVVDQEWCSMALLRPTDDSQQGGSLLPNSLGHLFLRYYTLKCAVSSRLLDGFAARNAQLHAGAAVDGAVYNEARLAELKRQILKSSSQNLEASPALLDFAARLLPVHGLKPVTMLNLLSFNKSEPGLESYKTYGRSFKEVGGKRGGDAKIVGKVVDGAKMNGVTPVGTEQWDEFAIVHYPNIVAFCDMAAGADYQEVNHKYRLPALRDTLLLASREMPLAAEPSDGPAKSDTELGGKL